MVKEGKRWVDIAALMSLKDFREGYTYLINLLAVYCRFCEGIINVICCCRYVCPPISSYRNWLSALTPSFPSNLIQVAAIKLKKKFLGTMKR
jgi:hypothetical protein